MSTLSHSGEIRATLWPQRLIATRISLNRSSRMMVLLGLVALAGNSFWLWQEGIPAHDWFHPAYISSLLIAVIILYALRQITHTRRRLMPLGYPLLERESHRRGLELWKSVEPLTRRPVHLYLARPEKFPQEPKAWENLTRAWSRRAEKARRLTSPHATRLFDYGFALGNRFYTAVELARGITLRTLVSDYGPCPADRAYFLLAQIAHAIQDAHNQGLDHLDIRPDAIRISNRPGAEDWTTLMLLNHDLPPEENAAATREDLRRFGLLAAGLLTGAWPDDRKTPNAAALEQAMAEHGAPYAMRDLFARYIGPDHDAPPLSEGMRRLNAAMASGSGWNQDRAVAWWAQHQPNKGNA